MLDSRSLGMGFVWISSRYLYLSAAHAQNPVDQVCTSGNSRFLRTRTTVGDTMIRMYAALFVALMLVTYIPAFSEFLSVMSD